MNLLRIGKYIILSLLLIVLSVVGYKIYSDKKGFSGPLPKVITETTSSAPTVTPPREVVNLQDSFAQVAAIVKPAVVNISAIQIRDGAADPHQFYYGDPDEFFRRFFGEAPEQKKTPQKFRSEGTGSGVIIDPDGFILTNNHVIQNADQLNVTLSDGKEYRGKLVGTDARTDLAVIRISGSNPFPFIGLGDSSLARVGDWVLAVGSPFGLEQTVTAGIISAIRQSLNIEGRLFRDLIQTDAAINRGNSGGPLVNLEGKVVGINTAIYAPTGVFSGIGFAIPVNRAKSILRELIEKGYVERSWMGVEILAIDDVIAGQFGLKSTEGALVNSIIPDSPADKAGFERGDVVVEFKGTKIKSVVELQDIVSQTPPGETINVKIIRDGKSKVLKLVTAVMPSHVATGDSNPDKTEAQTTEWLGARISDISAELKQRYSVAEDVVKGIMLVDVPVESIASEAGLMEGDIIAAVNRVKIDNVQSLLDKRKKLTTTEGYVFDVLRRGRWIYLTFKSLAQ